MEALQEVKAEVRIESLKIWIERNNLSVRIIDNKILEIEDVGKFLIVSPKKISIYNERGQVEVRENVVFDDEFQVILSESENSVADNVDFLLFEFGDKWYYTDDLVPDTIREFRYIGKPDIEFKEYKFSNLGIHGGYELCSGSRTYEDWILKSKFLGLDAIGICEENTLAGTLSFQEACIKNEIKSIIGETITILTDTRGKMSIKLYVENQAGWENLLKINKIINVDFNGEYIPEDTLWMDCEGEGLVCILTTEVKLEKYFELFTTLFKKVYYQVDFSEWAGQDKDKKHLLALKDYFDNYYFKVKPILICDSYYLEKGDSYIRKILNSIGKVGFKNQSNDQYFKTMDDIFLGYSYLFKENEQRFFDIIEGAEVNLEELCSSIDFKIPTKVFQLPQYEMNDEESGVANSNEELFNYYLNQGFDRKVKDSLKKIYLERLKEEVEVIKKGGFIDYFLILRDVIKWCEKEDIWVGMGRGSAAGSLVSYLLGIVKIDPLDYGLLFSRFLNAGRIGSNVKVEYILIATDDGEIEIESNNIIRVIREDVGIDIKAIDIKEGDILERW